MKRKTSRLALCKETVLDLSASKIAILGGVPPTDIRFCGEQLTQTCTGISVCWGRCITYTCTCTV